MYTSQGKLALVNLSSGEVTITCTPQQLVEKYLGGRGLNMYYLHKLLKTGVDPLSPDNVLIFGAGLLTGTLAPNSSRINITAKSPESGILGDANMGGFLGAEMRLAGFDRLIILGKAPAPVYLYLEDGELEIRPADPYWGYNVNDTQKLLRRDLGPDIQVACISRAGEKLVRMACVMTGIKNAAGRGGIGAVMGSKNLKAVVARGNQGLEVHDAPGLFQTRLELQNYLRNSKVCQVLGKVGTPLLYENMYAVTDCLGICKFVCHSFNSPHLLKKEHFSTLIKEATGLEFSPEDLLEAGKRVIDLERLFNLREGVTRADDTLPKRYFDDEMPAGNTKGHKIDREQFDRLLSRYYRLRNWNEDGRPAPERVADIEGLAAMDLEAIEMVAGGRGLHNG